MRRASIGLLTATLIAGVSLSPTPALAAPVAASCGAILTSDAYLADDLTCTGDALTLTGDIVLDLRGHRLVATGGTAVTVTGEGSPSIRDGRITDSSTGLEPAFEETDTPLSPRALQVARVVFARNQVAINMSGTDGNLAPGRVTSLSVWRSRFLDNGAGISGSSTGPVRVGRSAFDRNGQAVRVDTGSATIDRTTFRRNGVALSCEEAGCRLSRSRLWKNAQGIDIRTGSLAMWRTRISGSDVALSAFNIGGVQVTRNTFSRNRIGVELFFAPAVLRDNSFSKNTVGFTADSLGIEGVEATLIRNRFTKNRDGIFSETEGLRLRRNRAHGNTRWGIYAVNATDLGGNRASGNGQSPQCVGVAC